MKGCPSICPHPAWPPPVAGAGLLDATLLLVCSSLDSSPYLACACVRACVVRQVS